MLGGYIGELEKGDVFEPVEYVLTAFMASVLEERRLTFARIPPRSETAKGENCLRDFGPALPSPLSRLRSELSWVMAKAPPPGTGLSAESTFCVTLGLSISPDSIRLLIFRSTER